VRSVGYAAVTPGEKLIAQYIDGTAMSTYYLWYASDGSFLSYTGSSSSAVTVPTGAAQLRVRVTTGTSLLTGFTGNIYRATSRKDYSGSVYAALLLTHEDINLRVAKGDVINQINVSPEAILIAGNKVHITGETSIDSAVIGTAQIADAAITNVKVASLNAGKINAGTLAAARIAASSITADKLAANALQVGLSAWSDALRIAPTKLEWYSGSVLEGRIDKDGMTFYSNGTLMSQIADMPSVNGGHGMITFLYGGNAYASWARQPPQNAGYEYVVTIDPDNVLARGAGIHLESDIYTYAKKIYTLNGQALWLLPRTFSSVLAPSLENPVGGAAIAFGANGHLWITTGGSTYNMTNLISAIT
jgi:hypothetical protein